MPDFLQARKNGGELSESDAADLERTTQEQAVIQKQLEQARKQQRQHQTLIQEYRNKQQQVCNVSKEQSQHDVMMLIQEYWKKYESSMGRQNLNPPFVYEIFMYNAVEPL